ncbi:MAG: FtsX-like permease family protein [Gammaproteobacteria bacterium]|nr:FtsX-like permease family protein [Gammaproteobacteria bacterium]
MKLTLLIQLGWRNLWRHRRRNGMLCLAVAVGVGGLMFIDAMLRGWQSGMVEDVIKNLTGNIKVHAAGYRDDPSVGYSFVLPEVLTALLDNESSLLWTQRVVVPAVLMSERETRGVSLVGVEPGEEADLSFLGEVAIDGEALSSADDARIVIGAELARQLETRKGKRIVMMTQGADSTTREAGMRIAGVYDAEGTGLEKIFAFTGRAALQRLLEIDGVTEVSVRTDGDEDTEARLLGEIEGALPQYDVAGWRTLQPAAAAMTEYADMGIWIWYSIMLLALAFGLMNTLINAVLERVRELGLLHALGMGGAGIVVQVVIESLLIVGLGTVLGVMLGLGLVQWLADGIDLSRWAQGVEFFNFRTLLVPELLLSDVITICVLVMGLGFVGSLYPAWRAVRLDPLDAMHRH